MITLIVDRTVVNNRSLDSINKLYEDIHRETAKTFVGNYKNNCMNSFNKLDEDVHRENFVVYFKNNCINK